MTTAGIRWDTLLTPSPAWAHLVVASEHDAEGAIIGGVPAHLGVVARVLRGARCGTKRETLREWAAALQFPWYFGENWDSFEECINDLSWLPARGYVLLVTDAHRVLSDVDALSTFLHILDDAASRWADTDDENRTHPVPLPVSLHVVFQCEARREDEARARFADAGIELDELRLP